MEKLLSSIPDHGSATLLISIDPVPRKPDVGSRIVPGFGIAKLLSSPIPDPGSATLLKSIDPVPPLPDVGSRIVPGFGDGEAVELVDPGPRIRNTA